MAATCAPTAESGGASAPSLVAAPSLGERAVRTLHEVLFNKLSMRLSLVIVAAGAALPSAGAGIDVCWFKVWTHGHPCPGCGLTRSVSSSLRLEFAEAIAYHPFGPIILALSLVLASANFWPRSWHGGVEAFLYRHAGVGARIYQLLLGAFLFFGVARLIATFVWPELFRSL